MVSRPASSPVAWGSSVGSLAAMAAAEGDRSLLLRRSCRCVRSSNRSKKPSGRGSARTGRQRLRGQVRAIGVAAFPALLRALRSDHAGLVDWACDLLSSVTDQRLPELCERIDTILIDPRVSDASKAHPRPLGRSAGTGARRGATRRSRGDDSWLGARPHHRPVERAGGQAGARSVVLAGPGRAALALSRRGHAL